MKLTYTHNEKSLQLRPLKGEIDPDESQFSVGKYKVEIKLRKRVLGKWGTLEGDMPDGLFSSISVMVDLRDDYAVLQHLASNTESEKPRLRSKNWESIATDELSKEKEKGPGEDPNTGGDSTVNSFFQSLYANADEDTKRAMLKSYTESGGTTLSTNWEEVGKGKVDVKPPEGSEWKQWG